MQPATNQRLRLSGGSELAFTTAGDPSNPGLLLIHGMPNSSRMFRDVIPPLSEIAYVIAPDLPGYGQSDVLPTTTFQGFGEAITELLRHLSAGPRYIYLHDFGAPAGLHVAMQAPDLVLGLIIQNANAHQSGMGPQWETLKEFWKHPTPENTKAAFAHLTFEGTRDQYLKGVPAEVTARIPPERWEEDWRVMQLPGRLDAQRAQVVDYANYVAQFDAIAEYLKRYQPPALMIWGRHDIYFDLAETLSWMEDLPRMEAHVLDSGHLLLETHSAAAARLMRDFIARTRSAKSVVTG